MWYSLLIDQPSYSDDAKLFSYVKCEEDSFRLQKDIDSVIQWMEMCLLRLNTTKCKAMTYGTGPGICTSYSISSDAVEKNWKYRPKGLGVTCRILARPLEMFPKGTRLRTITILWIFIYLLSLKPRGLTCELGPVTGPERDAGLRGICIFIILWLYAAGYPRDAS